MRENKKMGLLSYFFLSLWTAWVFLLIQFGTQIIAYGIINAVKDNIGFGILFAVILLVGFFPFLGVFYIVIKFIEKSLFKLEQDFNVYTKIIREYIFPIGLYFLITSIMKSDPIVGGLFTHILIVIIAIIYRETLDKLTSRFVTKHSEKKT